MKNLGRLLQRARLYGGERLRAVVNRVRLVRRARRVFFDFERGFDVNARLHFDAMLGERLAVDEHERAAHLYGLARQTYDALDEIVGVRRDGRDAHLVAAGVVAVAWVLEDDDVAAADFTLGQEERGRAGGEDELINQEVVADVDGVLHRAGRDADGAPYERDEEDEHDRRVDGGLEVLTPHALRRSLLPRRLRLRGFVALGLSHLLFASHSQHRK